MSSVGAGNDRSAERRPLLVRVGRGLLVLVPFLAAGGIAFYGSLMPLVAALIAGDNQLVARPFDPALWNHPDWEASESVETSWHSIRQGMVDDLLERHLPVGLPRAEVLALLGPQDEDAFFRPDADAWVYRLGRERGAFAIDSEWLCVAFDDEGRLAEAYLATD